MCEDDTETSSNLRFQRNHHTQGNHMKFLLALALLSSVAFANEAKKEETQEAVKTEAVAEVKKEEVKSDKKADKKAAYKAAKEACLKENKDLKGKELKECIVSKNK